MATSVDSAAVLNHSLSADRSEAAKLVAAYFRKPPSYDEFLKLGAVLRQLLKEPRVI